MLKPPKATLAKPSRKRGPRRHVKPPPIVRFPSRSEVDRLARELYRADRESEWVPAALGQRLHLWPSNFALLTQRRREGYEMKAREMLTVSK